MEAKGSKPVSEGFVFKRQLLIERGEGADEPLLEALRQLAGVVSADLKKSDRLVMRYDASQLQIDTIIALLEEQGVRLRRGLWRDGCVSWYRYTDNNAAYNAKRTDVHCCNKPPRGR